MKIEVTIKDKNTKEEITRAYEVDNLIYDETDINWNAHMFDHLTALKKDIMRKKELIQDKYEEIPF